MKLVIINGSPRGKKSNSDVIANWMTIGILKSAHQKKYFAEKYNSQEEGADSNEIVESVQVDKFYAANVNSHRNAVDSIEDNSTVVVVFPLYVDAMPAITKLLFEELETIANQKENVKIYYIVHSGFEGAKHCRAVERYLVYLSDHLGFKYMGTTIKPGSEGLRLTPPNHIVEIRDDFMKLAEDIAEGSKFNSDTLKKLAGFELPPEEYKTRVKQSNGNTGYFSELLKQNDALDKCFDKPYQREE